MAKHLYWLLIIALLISTIVVYRKTPSANHGQVHAKTAFSRPSFDYAAAAVCIFLVLVGNRVRRTARRTS